MKQVNILAHSVGMVLLAACASSDAYLNNWQYHDGGTVTQENIRSALYDCEYYKKYHAFTAEIDDAGKFREWISAKKCMADRGFTQVD